MADYMSGADALNALTQEGGGGSDVQFTSFKTNTTFKVKVLGTADLISFFSYGIFKKVNSFVAANPSKKSAKGYPVENLTPWDLAWKFHKDQSKDFSDAHGQEAGKYRCKQRFAVGFFDLDAGEPIIIDVSKPQAQAIFTVIKKYEKKLDKLAFELTKSGSGTSTTVSLSPVIDLEEDLTDKERANFEKAPAEFDKKLFDGLLYELDEAAMVDALVQAGFDVSLIGLTPSKQEEGTPLEDGIDVVDDALPF